MQAFGIIFAGWITMQLEGSSRKSLSAIALHFAKTTAQIALVWSIFLLVIPELLVRVEMVSAIPTFAETRWQLLGLLLFMAASTVFLLSIGYLVLLGEGTPWPWDRSTHFVIAGPYRHLRNPLVLAGIAQGFASALILGSYLGLVYVIVGAAAWNFILRPMEEEDLARRFGKAYIEYFQSVHAHVPSAKAHRNLIIDASADVASVSDSPY